MKTKEKKEKTIDSLIENSFEGALQEVKEKNTPLNELKRVHKDAQENALLSKKEAEERQSKMSAFDLVTENEEQKPDVSTTMMMTKFVKKEIVLYLLKPEGSVRSIFDFISTYSKH